MTEAPESPELDPTESTPDEAERYWRVYLLKMRDSVLAAYPGSMTIDVLAEPAGKLRPIGKVRRAARPTPRAARP